MKILLIAGGSASGKTTLARRLAEAVPGSAILSQDSFYICQSRRVRDARGHLDFDTPDALDFASMAVALTMLKQGQNATIPVYDFATHSRTGEEVLSAGMQTLIVEGTLVMSQPPIRALAYRSYFVSAREELRRARREARDVAERGRTLEDVRRQLREQVFPAHNAHVEPCAGHASRVLCADTLARDLDRVVGELVDDLVLPA